MHDCLSVATNLSFGWVWMVVCFWYTLKCGLKHHWANSGGKTPLTFSWHLSRSKAAMAKMFEAGGKMKNKAEKESEVTAATKPNSSSGLKINCNLGALSKFRFYPAGGWEKASCSPPWGVPKLFWHQPKSHVCSAEKVSQNKCKKKQQCHKKQVK